MDLGLQGRTAIISGSSRGIGLACARALAQEGADVVINGRDPERLERAAEILREDTGVTVIAVRADIATAEGRANILEAAPAPDILVTNSAGPQPGSLFDVADEDIAKALDGHFWAPLHLLKAVAPGMRARRFGRVVNITSAMVASPDFSQIGSVGARTGMTAMMKATSRQLAPDNVLINQILPFRIASDRQRDMALLESKRDGVSVEEAWKRQAANVPVRRHGELEEIGAACAFLCSARHGYINGVNLRVDGGAYSGLI